MLSFGGGRSGGSRGGGENVCSQSRAAIGHKMLPSKNIYLYTCITYILVYNLCVLTTNYIYTVYVYTCVSLCV